MPHYWIDALLSISAPVIGALLVLGLYWLIVGRHK